MIYTQKETLAKQWIKHVVCVKKNHFASYCKSKACVNEINCTQTLSSGDSDFFIESINTYLSSN